MSPSSTNRTSGSSATRGKRARKTSASCQWVVAGRPSSIPAAASTNAPVQIETIRVPGRICASAAATAGGSGPAPSSSAAAERAKGAITTVSAAARASGPCSTAMAKSAAVRTAAPSTEQVRTA